MKPAKTTAEGPVELLEAIEFDFSTRAYLAFNQGFDEQLEQLVETWKHLAAPAALRVGRGTLQPRKS